MTGLLVLTGLLMLVSGGVKVRAGLRAGVGVQILTILELVAAVLWCAAAMVGAGTVGTGMLFVPTGVVLVLVSSVLFHSRMTAYRRERAESEGRRLANFVKYLSNVERDTGSES